MAQIVHLSILQKNGLEACLRIPRVVFPVHSCVSVAILQEWIHKKHIQEML